MDSKQIMKLALKGKVDEVARCLGMARSSLYNQMNSEEYDIVGRFVDLCNCSGSDLIVKWVCDQLGGTFVPNIRITESDLQREASETVARALKEFADIVTVIGEAIADNVIDESEATDIRREWQELKAVLEAFVCWCEAEVCSEQLAVNSKSEERLTADLTDGADNER